MRIDDMKPGPELDKEAARLLGINIHIALGEKLSTTWEGMHLVVEEMQRRKYAWRIEGLRAAFFDPYAGSPADDGTLVYAEAIGETTPHGAILAAIKALQGEDNG